MKRHGFTGLGASHGTQRKHRSPGSIGACATPSRVFKGVRMAGRMGAVRQTTQNLTVHAVDAERGLLLIKGAVPGPRGRRRARSRPPRRGPDPMADTDTHRRPSTPSGKPRPAPSLLPEEVFDVQTNVPLIHQVVVAQLAAARQGTHATKNRGEVRGGGRKPYKQKGTGRARQGSTRAPQFTGGGVVHGPTPRGLRAADAQEDEGRRAARRALRPGPARPGARGARPGRAARRPRPRQPSPRWRGSSERRNVLRGARARGRGHLEEPAQPGPGARCSSPTS